jgi:hypothetical protein
MTLKIEATIPYEDVKAGKGMDYLASVMWTLGYTRTDSAPKSRQTGVPGTELTDSEPAQTLGEAIRAEAAAPAEKPKRNSTKKADKPAISTGEERVGPEDSPEVQAQDAADEAAEGAGKTTLTLDDVRRAAGRYQKKHGLAAATKNIPAILGCAIADVPDDQLSLTKAVEAIDNATEEVIVVEVAAEKPAETKVFTKDDVKAAMIAYGKKFDKTADPALMAHTKVDVSRIFSKLFGEAVKTLSQVPDTAEAYGRAVDAINRAVTDDPFNRGA